MGLFDKKTEAEKAKHERIQETRRDARGERRDERREAREERQDARDAAREERKDARDDKRDAITDIRDAGLSGKDKREEKKNVRDEKRGTIEQANDRKRDAIDKANDDRRTNVQAITLGEIADIQRISGDSGVGFSRRLAIDLLRFAQQTEYDSFGASGPGTRGADDRDSGLTLRGSSIRGVVAITRKNWKSDTEAYVAHSDAGDVIVGFRSSESKEGGLRDWVLTDFRSHRMPYPAAPGTWPNQRWVHTGFWEAYELVKNELLVEVSRQMRLVSNVQTVYVTGFSLGGALALLAAMDIGDAIKGTPVELVTFAAPRVGDDTLNKLLAERVQKSLLIAYGGDPFVHLPPLGPNSPVTFKQPFGVDVAGLHLGLGNPLPSVGQQYRTADRLVYIDRNGVAREGFPPAQIALDIFDHSYDRYLAALGGAATASGTATGTGAAGTTGATRAPAT